MDSNPYLNLNFVDLLQSQQDSDIGLECSPIPLSGTQATQVQTSSETLQWSVKNGGPSRQQMM